jgi:hypothetical protein
MNIDKRLFVSLLSNLKSMGAFSILIFSLYRVSSAFVLKAFFDGTFCENNGNAILVAAKAENAL